MNFFQKMFRKAAVTFAKTIAFAPAWARYAFTKFTPTSLVEEGYKANAVVSACSTTLQLTFPEPPLVAGYEEDGRFIPDYKHQLNALLKRPNPDMGMAEFLQFVITYAPIGGDTFVWKQRNSSGRVIALWPFSDLQFTPIRGKSTEEGMVAYYEYDPGDGKKIPISKNDVIQWKWMIDPSNPHKGIGAIALSAREVDRDSEATSYIFALLKNNAVPPVVITLEPGDDPTQDELDRMGQMWVQKHSKGQPAFITNGMKAEQMGFDLQKLAAESLADLPETRIAANFKVPPSVAGLNVGVKRSDYGDTAARKAFTEQTLMALWRSFASEMLNGLMDEFNVPANFALQFDLRNVGALQEQKKDQWERVTLAFNRSMLTRAQALREVGLVPGQNDDVYFVSLASEFVPAGMAVVRAPSQPPPNGKSVHLERGVKAMPAAASMLRRIRVDVAGRMRQAIDAHFSQLADRIVERLGKGSAPSEEKKLPRAESLINSDDRKTLETLVKRFYVEVLQLSWETWNVSLGIEKAFDLTDPTVTYVLRMAGTRVKEIESTTLDALREALKYGNDNGWSVDMLVRGDPENGIPGLRDIIDETYKDRARVIARTELGEAQNTATSMRYRDAGVKLVEILDNGSDDDDEECKIANGQIWTLTYFESHSLEHPNCTRAAAPYFGDASPDRG